MEQTEIVNIIIETINSIFSNLFSSIDNNIYSNLDEFTFINSNIIGNSFFEKLLGANGKNGIIYLTDALLVGVIIYYGIRYMYSSFSGNFVEKPSSFVLRMIILGIMINGSYFICEQILNINYLLSESIREIGASIINSEISFSELISKLNSTISVGDNSFDLFSFDGIIKSFISVRFIKYPFFLFIKIYYGSSFYIVLPSRFIIFNEFINILDI